MKKKLDLTQGDKNWLLSVNFLFVLLILILSFFFSPVDTYDRARHAERFDAIAGGESDFLDYFVFGDQKDFLYYIFMYIGNEAGLGAPAFFAILNALTACLLLYGISQIIDKRYLKLFWLFFVLSISYISLFSGVRFYLAMSFFSMFALCFSRGSMFKAFCWIVVASVTHFSFSAFALAFLLKIKPGFLRPMFLVVFGLALLSVSGILDIYTAVSFLSSSTSSYEGFGEAAKSYAELKGESHRNLFFYILNFWVFVPAVFFALKYSNESRFGVLLMTSIIVMLPYADNYPVFGRYFLVMNLLCFCCLADVGVTDRTKSMLYALGVSGGVRFFLDIHDNFDAYVQSFF